MTSKCISTWILYHLITWGQNKESTCLFLLGSKFTKYLRTWQKKNSMNTFSFISVIVIALHSSNCNSEMQYLILFNLVYLLQYCSINIFCFLNINCAHFSDLKLCMPVWEKWLPVRLWISYVIKRMMILLATGIRMLLLYLLKFIIFP
jgi:hypothetical protein